MNQVAKMPPQPLQTAQGDFSAEALIYKGIEQNIPVESLERLLAMRTTLKAEAAKEAYFSAFSAFQASLPIIQKSKEVKDKSGNVRYRYAPLDDIIRQVSPMLRDNGLSFNLDVKQGDKSLTAIVKINHIQGHSEKSEFTIPIDDGSFMNDAQKAGSANAYAKRYALCNALGILTGDQDDDGQSLGNGLSAQEIYRYAEHHMLAVMENIASIMAVKNSIAIKEYERAAEAWYELNTETRQDLWVAPKKGGCFTTEERRIIKDELSKFRPEGQGDVL